MTVFEDSYWSSRRPGTGAKGIFGTIGVFLSFMLGFFQLDSLLRTTRKYAATGVLLDAGCGLGQFLNVAQKNFHSYGLDVSRVAIGTCKKSGLEVTLGSAETPCFRDKSFDVIMSLDVLEHLNLPSVAIKRLSDLLKPNGVIVIRTPNLGSIGSRFLDKDWFGYRDPTHISLRTRDYWIRLVEESGLTIERSFSDSLFFLVLGENKISNTKAVLRYLPLFTIGLLSLMGFNLGLRYPPIGENLCLIARKVEG